MIYSIFHVFLAVCFHSKPKAVSMDFFLFSQNFQYFLWLIFFYLCAFFYCHCQWIYCSSACVSFITPRWGFAPKEREKYIYIYFQNLRSYDFEWGEITARWDLPLLLCFQIKWNNSKGRLEVRSIRLKEDPFPSGDCCV